MTDPRPIGIVLSGGESRRMGTDKGLLSLPGGTFSSAVRGLLLPHCEEVRISVRRIQLQEYSAIFPDKWLIADDAGIAVRVGGPLAGILTASLFFPDRDIFFIPCDMPFLSPSIIERIAHTHKTEKGWDACLVAHEGIEPLVGIYDRGFLKLLLDRSMNRPERDFSLMGALRDRDIQAVPANPDEANLIKNINTPADLIGAEAIS